jgi:putative zinc finger protein
MTAGGHLTSEEVAAYLDNTLSEAESARVKSHLADCDACRQEVVAVSKLLAGASRSKRRFAALSTLAAAAVIAVFLVRSPIDSKSPLGGPLRGRDVPSASEGVSGLKAIAPIGRQTNADRIVFVWHPALPGATYRFTLADDRGGKIWVASTNDTTVSIPAETSLLKDRDYHWYVDVLQPDGSSATTGITSFQVAR